MDEVLLPNPTEGEDVSNGDLIRPYFPVAFYSGFRRDAALSRVTVDRDVAPPGVSYILH